MKIISNTYGQSLAAGILVVTMMVVIFYIFFTVIGLFLNNFLYIFSAQLLGDLSLDSQNSMNYVFQYVRIFYLLPVIFLILLGVWMFKIVFYRTKYTRYRL